MAKLKINKEIEIVNRKAAFEYKFIQEFEAGIMLTGTEVKSVRVGDVNLKDAFCFFRKGELYIKNLYIAEFKYGNLNNHETRRLRKLLLKKPELAKIEKKMKEKGFTLVPYKLYISERGFIKLEVCLSQGKKSYDKRATIKERENKRVMGRINKIKL